VGFHPQRMHTFEELIAAGEDVAQLVNSPDGWHTLVLKEPAFTDFRSKLPELRA